VRFEVLLMAKFNLLCYEMLVAIFFLVFKTELINFL